VQSYNGALDFGLTACRKTVPELGKLAGYLEESLLELKEAVFGEAPTAKAAAPARKRAATPAKATRLAKPIKTARPAKTMKSARA